jgi:hypothetical protein
MGGFMTIALFYCLKKIVIGQERLSICFMIRMKLRTFGIMSAAAELICTGPWAATICN